MNKLTKAILTKAGEQIARGNCARSADLDHFCGTIEVGGKRYDVSALWPDGHSLHELSEGVHFKFSLAEE